MVKVMVNNNAARKLNHLLIWLLTLVSMISTLSLTTVRTEAAVSWPSPVSSSKPIQVYPISTANNIPVYNSSHKRESGRALYGTDLLYVYQIKNGWITFTYPSGNKRRTGYAPLSTITSASAPSAVYTSRAGMSVYRRSSGSQTIGSIAKGDKVYILSTSNSRVQVIYNLGSAGSPKGWKSGWITQNNYNSYIKPVSRPVLTYQAHVSNIGWQSYVKEGATAGTTGQSQQIEALILKLSNVSGSIQYRTHIQDKGWVGWSTNGKISGTTGQSKRAEAVQIKLTGTVASQYDIYYRVHCQNYGWLGWAKNGVSAGTEGGGLRMEAIQIKLVAKGQSFNCGGTAYHKITSKSNSGSNTSTGGFDPIWPCRKTYTVSTLYKYSSGAVHSTRFKYGIDIAAPSGEEVLAVESGKVITSAYSTTSGFGNWIMIQHNNGKVSLYAHLSVRNVKVGQTVTKGQVIGKVGNTSAKYNINAHLHFELGNSNTGGAAGDPWREYFKPKYGNIVTLVQAAKKYPNP